MTDTFCSTVLADDTPVVIRPVTPEDRHLFEIGMAHLSDRSRYFRFLASTKALSEEMLTFLTTGVGEDHVIMGALDMTGGVETPAGVARYVRFPDDPTAAEFAVTIVDSHHRRGLGSLLIGMLARHAVRHGVNTFVGLVHIENLPMRRLCEALGAAVATQERDAVEYRIALHPDPEDDRPADG